MPITAACGVLLHRYPHKLVAEWSAPVKLESAMKTREMTNDVLNDETLESVAGGIWDDGGCIPDFLGKLLQKILHPSNPGGPINAK
jgi:hypothetical protein